MAVSGYDRQCSCYVPTHKHANTATHAHTLSSPPHWHVWSAEPGSQDFFPQVFKRTRSDVLSLLSTVQDFISRILAVSNATNFPGNLIPPSTCIHVSILFSELTSKSMVVFSRACWASSSSCLPVFSRSSVSFSRVLMRSVSSWREKTWVKQDQAESQKSYDLNATEFL